MNEILLITFISISVISIGVLVWLFFRYKRLNQDHLILNDQVKRIHQDIAGLCSAAVFVDSQISENVKQIKKGIEKKDKAGEQLYQQSLMHEHEHEHEHEQNLGLKNEREEHTFDNPEPPYNNAIEGVRNGADSGDLIRQYGVSREEAELLIRLHGHA